MARNFIKIVKGRNGRLYYYRGDGLWFGRIGEDEAIKGLKSKKYRLWGRFVPKPKQIDIERERAARSKSHRRQK